MGWTLGQTPFMLRRASLTRRACIGSNISAAADPWLCGSRPPREGSATDHDSMPRKHHHNVYVIELDSAILNTARFRTANPNRDTLKLCVYVGMTGRPPEERCATHKAGIRDSRY